MKVAIITGAAAGIGAATARRFRDDGYRLVLADIDVSGAEAIAGELDALPMRCDVSDESDVAALIDAAMKAYGRIDCMINNAGILGAVGPIGKTPAEDYRKAMSIMSDGVFYGIKHASNAMEDGGVILNTASIAGIGAWSNHSYTAAKHAVVALTRSSAVELAPRNIRVNAVAPGNVVTQITISLTGSEEAAVERAMSRNPLPHVCTAEDIAASFAFLAGSEARGITGQVLVVDSGLSAIPIPASYHLTESRYVG
ncbi:SDR family oxidoreductase [Paracoccus siganidrum]|uniref:SDR family oxidoreductase n=1 Tax=Paracoccus siganidrum TaxID=1276757 RepID=A0A419AAW0_9RHOB|nr:SDR family oxidoreductase [Paracoccus siganidrum]RJL20265.1 SDR family oxidoreductase [Paracoccus siganidrum]RMC30723.1 short-chain dehydrogenase [Paracoccus siganidrum]